MKLQDMKHAIQENEIKEKIVEISCCRSYLTPKGRCYTCPEMEALLDADHDEEQ